MRVITGKARGVRLVTLSGEETRPTAERVKEALFSAVQFDIEGRRVLDLFAGSGQLGIEALSRGAAHCTFVDRSGEAAALVRQNVQAAGLFSQAVVLCLDSLAFLARPAEPYDLVFLDPPYAAGLLPAALSAVEPHLNAGAIVMAECDSDTVLPAQVGRLRLQKSYRYGRVCLHKYVREAEE